MTGKWSKELINRRTKVNTPKRQVSIALEDESIALVAKYDVGTRKETVAYLIRVADEHMSLCMNYQPEQDGLPSQTDKTDPNPMIVQDARGEKAPSEGC